MASPEIKQAQSDMTQVVNTILEQQRKGVEVPKELWDVMRQQQETLRAVMLAQQIRPPEAKEEFPWQTVGIVAGGVAVVALLFAFAR